ncbi:LysR family transcriptional regulator [Paraburkholderia sp. J12]|uniref:LysR family transcriptional regulator n=1 Tax=Paraburkholderia sp. J12 TaxID=2805432 RepID=UPI002ABD3517|nr:LysR family transcriptional regulator [Paraburkholderia sp. J12]
MNLRQLEHVIALAEEGSFARAAQRVHLSQPALTRSIQTIEEELDVVLFDRTTREVQITPAGQIVMQRAKKVLFETRCLRRDVDLLKNHELGSVTFGAGPYPAAMLLPAALGELAGTHPRLRINAVVDSWKNVLAALYDETLDFLVMDIRGAQVTSEVNVITLPKYEAAWFVREGHPLARRAGLERRDLQAYPIVSVPLTDPMREALRRWLRFAPNQEMEFQVVCNDVNVLEEYARKTDSLLLLSTQPVWNPAHMKGLVPLAVPTGSPLWIQFGIVYLAGRTLSPAAEQAILAIQRVSGVAPPSPD